MSEPPSPIQAFDPLCEVQSDKASVEITSPFDGIVKELLVQEGEVAKVGSGLCLIEVEEEDEAAENKNNTNEPAVEPVSSSPEKETRSPPTGYESKLEGSHEEQVSKRRHPLDPNYTPDAVSVASSNVLATPSVRHFSRQMGVDLAQLAPGSGKGGRIERKDVDAFLAGESGAAALGPCVDDRKDVVVELGRTRYGMWKATPGKGEVQNCIF